MLRVLLRHLAGAAVLGCWLATLGGLAAPVWATGELLANLVPLLASGFLLAGAALLLLREPRRLPRLAALAGLAWQAVALLPLWLPPPEQALAEPRPLRVAFANVLASRRPRARLLEHLAALDADLVALAEVGPHYREPLAALRRRLPHAFAEYRGDCFGLAIFSRWPLEDRRVLLPDGHVPVLSARLLLPEGPVRLVAAHAPPPNWYPERHRRYLEGLVAACAGEDPVLLLGDLNATPWSPRFRDLVAAAGLRQARRGFGLQASWGPRPLPWALLPIDHVLLRGPWQVRSFRAGPRLGSDHRPVVAELLVDPGAGEGGAG